MQYDSTLCDLGSNRCVCEIRYQVVEYLNFLQDEVFLNPATMENGSYVLPQVLGWGLEMTESFVEKHTYPTGKVWQGREASGGVTFLA